MTTKRERCECVRLRYGLNHICLNHIWGMHSPGVGAVGQARLALQQVYDFYLRVICGLNPSTPRDMLLKELGLLPLQVYWWQQTMQFWNRIAALPAGSLFHAVLLDNLFDAFHDGAVEIAVQICKRDSTLYLQEDLVMNVLAGYVTILISQQVLAILLALSLLACIGWVSACHMTLTPFLC